MLWVLENILRIRLFLGKIQKTTITFIRFLRVHFVILRGGKLYIGHLVIAHLIGKENFEKYLRIKGYLGKTKRAISHFIDFKDSYKIFWLEIKPIRCAKWFPVLYLRKIFKKFWGSNYFWENPDRAVSHLFNF